MVSLCIEEVRVAEMETLIQERIKTEHLQKYLSNCKLSIMPRSLFVADGTMLHCSVKSKLMDVLEKMSIAETSGVTPPEIRQRNKRVLIIDAITDVQSMDKPRANTCKSFHCIYTKKI